MEKIKQFLESEKGKSILTVLIVIFVGFGSFKLGRLSKSGGDGGIKIEYLNQPANVISTTENPKKTTNNTNISSKSTDKKFFASNRGTKYYPLGCSAGDSLKLENRIYFNTREEAEGAGYELSSSCR